MRSRYILVVALLICGVSARAQSRELRSFEATTALDRTALKFVIQAMDDLDPTAEVFHSDDMRIVQVRASAEVTDAQIRSAMQTSGVQLREGRADLSSYIPPPDPNAPPVFLVTGNDTEDLSRYQAAVSQWNAAHPDQLMDPMPLHLNVR